ncbi:hypothetical protein KBB96_02145 [Luteolibacter ambystomatis]|uniref:DUF4381 domain-containing protein n=1 Tax=Luteolibacter ambystomatis TaxID=2824561 RepID=A0A975PFN7_9BACT|nr:hypothetical protein [Luteolibacter ambystomatis]QUE51701.1 hypothetical protein KBB96_02145 [Luteolibacter ambystomatis]
MDPKPSFELHPPPPPDKLLPGPRLDLPAWQIALAAIALILVILLIVLAIRKKRPVDEGSVRRRAYQDALRCLEEARPAGSREAATLSSFILRRYLAVVAKDPALYETHEEFVGRHDILKNVSDDTRHQTVEGFGHLASLKYGRETRAGEGGPVIQSSRSLLETLHRALAA